MPFLSRRLFFTLIEMVIRLKSVATPSYLRRREQSHIPVQRLARKRLKTHQSNFLLDMNSFNHVMNRTLPLAANILAIATHVAYALFSW